MIKPLLMCLEARGMNTEKMNTVSGKVGEINLG